MKPTATFNRIFASLSLLVLLFGASVTLPTGFAHGQTCKPTPQADCTCSDKKDNDGDGKADWDGAVIAGKIYPPDPSCINKDQTEKGDDVVAGSLVPCTNKCDLANFFKLLNTMISFLIKVILFPIAVLMFVYAGYKYITAQGNPAKKANVKKMIGHLILGMVIILTAWLVVKTVLVIIGYDSSLLFFQE